MKTVLKYLIFPVVLVIFGYYFTMNKPDIRYTLSERIPVRLGEERSLESVQQLEVKNVGSSAAEKIQMIIKAKMISYDVLKYSKADTVNEFRSGVSTEIVYPSLPPEGSFTLLIRSSGDGIKKGDLTISHSQGKGKEAFSESRSGYTSLLGIVVVLFYATWIGWMIRGSAIDSLESNARFNSLSIIKRKKPFYLDAKRWKVIRNAALECKTRAFNRRDVEESASYSFLNGKRPNKLNDEDWSSSVKVACDTLYIILSEASMRCHTSGDVLDLLKIKKPVHYNEEDWIKLIDKIGDIYLLMLKTDYALSKKDGLLAAMKRRMPEQVRDDIRLRYRQHLEREYCNLLSQEMKRMAFGKSSPIDYLADQQLDLLSEEESDELRKQAYEIRISQLPDLSILNNAKAFAQSGKPDWMLESDHKSKLREATWIIDLDLRQQRYQALMGLLESILNQIPIAPSKPKALTDEEWASIVRIDKDFTTYSQNKESIAIDRNMVSGLRVRIERQLEIIHNILVDPNSIERIEDYSNVFAPGNFENLKRLSGYLKAIL